MTNDPLGLFDEEDKDPLGLFSVEDDTGFLKAAGESLLSLGTSSLAAIPAGLAGIGASVMGGSEKGAAKVAEIQDALTYQPRTERGQRYTENVAEVLNKPVEWLGAGGEAVAGNEGRLVGEIAGNFALDLLPFGAMGAAMRKGKPAKETSPKLNKLDKLEEATATPQADPLGLYDQGELDLFSPDQKQLGVSPYDAVGGKWAVDENGIPVKQELSEEVSRTQEGGQARLFDDPIFEEPATKKYVESEAAWQEKARQEQVAKMTAELKEKYTRPKRQTGAIDLGPNLKDYNVEVEPLVLGQGATTPTSIMVRLKNKDGKLAGFVDFSIREDGVLTAENAQVAGGLRGNGAAAQMYKAAREAGYDIAPGKVQTDLGIKMVESLQRKGLINKEADGPRFSAGDLNLAPLEGEALPGSRYIPKGQRGAIDVKAIEDGMKALSRGEIDPPNFLQRWKGTYNPKEWDSALKALDEPSSRDTIAFLSPEQFHSLAHVRTEAEVNSPMGAIRRASVKNALTTKAGLDDIPYLKGTIKDGVFEVEAHNGRHRMDVFQEKGLELVPVRLRAWKEDGFRGWGSEDAPKMAKGQEGNTMPLPQNLSKKGVGQAKPFKELSLVPKGQRGAIILAEKADKDISLAKNLFKQKMSPATIFDLTGAYRDIDGKWKTIVSDSMAKVLDSGFNKGRGRLSDFLDHPTLYKYHPELKDIFVLRTDENGASYFRQKNAFDVIHIDDTLSKADFRRLLLHELQHAIQENSKFSRGGNSTELAYKHNLPYDKAYSHYNALAGEQEARFVENTADLSQKALDLKTKELLQNEATPSNRIDEVKTVLSKRIIPRSQRGAIDVKAIGEAIKKFTSAFEKPEIKGTDTNVPTRESVLESLPGNKGALKDYIPKDPTAGEIVQGALSEKDSNLTMRGVQSGATITGMKYNSSLITGIGRLYQNAGKRAEKNIRDIVKPTEKTIMKVPKQELVELGGLMKREMFNDMTYTSVQLADAGFTPKQIDAYTQMREMFNEAWKVQNDALVSMGKKPLTKKESYLSSRWQGPWRTPVYDKNGKLVFYIAESSKKGAERALKHLADNADIDATKSKVEYRKQYGKERGELADAYRTMLAVLDPNDARVDAVRSVYEQGKMNEAFVALGQSKHFEAKAGVRGFMGDRPWMKEGTDIVEMFQQQFAYAKNAFTWAELGKATAESKKVLSNEELMEAQPNNMAYAQQYAKNKLGFGEHNGVAAIESSLAEAFGKDVQTARDFLGGWKSIFILSKLGLSPGYVMANLVQPLWTASWHADLSAKGYKHNPFTTFVYAGADSFGGLLKHYTGVEVEMTPLGTNALRYAEDNGIVSRDITDENAGLGANKIKQAGDVLGKATIGSVEHVARMEAFMSFVHHLDQSGKFTDEMKLFEKAEELVNASMVDYRPGERPIIFDQAGLVGSAAANLQTFKFNYYNQMHYFYNQAKKGDVRGLMAFLGTQAVVGGAVSMPFLQELDDAWEWLKTIVPDSVHLQIKDVGIKQEIVKALPDLVSFGGMSKITGADMSSRFDSGNLADFSLDGAFPFIADALKQGSAAASFAMNPTATTGAKAAYALAPPGPVQGAVETGMDIFKSGQTPTGKTVYKNPNKLELHDADYARTPGQEMYRKFGLRELEESKYRTQRMRQIRSETQTAERLRGQSTKFIDAIVRKDKEDINKYAQRYIAYGGDINSLNQLIETEAIKAQVPKEILDAARASSTNAVQKAKKMKELLNGFNY